MKLGDAIVHFGADRSGFQQGLAQTEQETRSWAGGLGSMINTAGGVMLANLATNVISAAGRMAMGLAKDAIKAVADFQLLEQGLQTLSARELKNKSEIVDANGKVVGTTMDMADAYGAAAPRAKELLDWAIQLGLQSPFDVNSVTDTLRMAMAYGFTSDEAQKLTEVMVDFTAGTGQSRETMQRVVMALGQIQAKGKLAGQEVLQLTNAGIPVYQILGKAFGKTTAELQDMQMKGLLPADKVIQAIVESLGTDFTGAGEKASQTWAGIISNAQEFKSLALASLFEGILKPLQEPLSGFLNELMTPQTLGALRELGNVIGQILTPGIKLLAAGMNVIIPIVAGLAAGFTALITAITANMIWPTLVAMFTAVSAAIGAISAPVWLVIGAIAALVAIVTLIILNFGKLRDAASNVAGFLSGVFQGAISGISTALSGLSNFLSGVFQGALDGVGTAISALANWLQGALATAVNLVAGIWQGVFLPALQAVGDFLNTYVIPLIAALINVWLALLKVEVAAVAAVWTNILLPALQNIGSFISGALAAAFNFLVGLLGGAVSAATAALAALWTGVLHPALSAVSGFVSGVLSGAFSALSGLLSGAVSGATRALASVWTGVLQPALSSVRGFVSGALSGALSALSGLLNGAVSGATHALASVWTGVLQPALSTVAGFVSGVLSGAFNALAGLLNGPVSSAARALSSVWTGVLQPALGSVSGFISGTVSPILQQLAGIVGGTVSAAVSGLAGIWSGVLSPAINGAVGAFNNVIAVMQGGLGAAVSAAQSWLSSLASTISGVLNGALGGLVGIANSVVGAISGIGGAVQGAIGGLNSMAATLNDVAAKIPSILKPGSPTPFERGIRGISDAVAELARIRLPELATQFNLTGGGPTTPPVNQRNFYITAQYRNYQSETSLRDTIAALSML